MRPFLTHAQPLLVGTTLIAGIFLTDPAFADAYTVSAIPAMDLGQVVAATEGDTVFQVVPSSGQVNLLSGSGRRLSNQLVRVVVTIQCLNGGYRDDEDSYGDRNYSRNSAAQCDRTPVSVTIGSIGLTTGRAKPLTNFTVAMTSASLSGGVSGTNPINFTLAPIGNNQSRSFYLGADFPVAGDDSGRFSGLGLAPFYIYVTTNTGESLASTLGTGSVLAYRGLSVTKTSDLSFGTVSLAKTSGTVSIDPTTGARTVTGGGFGYPSPSYGPATFVVSGEGGQTISVSVPTTLQLSGPTNLNVITRTTVSGTPTLSNAFGMAGTYTFSVGGSFPIANGSIPGSYTGTLSVSVDYN